MTRLFALGLMLAAAAAFAEDPPPPNILWLSVEDIDASHGCYGDPDAITPNIDKLAAEGVRYTNVYTVAPVCAPNRSCIITGVYPTTLGSLHMRSSGEGRLDSHQPSLPESIRCFPEYLRRAGYYCTNNSKQDYNFAPTPEETWDESSGKATWQNRPDPKQPFFAVFNFVDTHESKVRAEGKELERLTKSLTDAERHDPAKLHVPPYHPDTPKVRQQWANYHDLITVMDHWIAEKLQELEDAGVADNTIVVYWSDHGAGLPRHKRWLYDSGTHVPMVVYAPKALQERYGITPGTTDEQLISALDFAPTTLALAGVARPDFMQGQVFLGPEKAEPRTYAYSARDRMDERYDIVRSVRDSRYRYIRNYQPWVPYHQYIDYCERGDVQKELRRLLAEDALPEGCAWFGLPEKPVEELYDMEADRYSLHNLADDPAQAEVLERLRGAMLAWSRDTRDLGFLPEAELNRLEQRFGTRYEIYQGMQEADPDFWNTLYTLVAGSGTVTPDDTERLTKALQSKHGAIRYWAVVSLGRMQPLTDDARTLLLAAREDTTPEVRVVAAEALLKQGTDEQAQLDLLADLLKDDDMWVRVAAATALDNVGEKARPVIAALQAALDDPYNKYVARVANHAVNTLLGTDNEVR
ncbi:MAG: sulfatase-like hydrolase/transferase [Candidatus Hydrogenedens sp.]|nr:sulfatase-like hydrolase/transferase [Candidatus Hydrogenedens sp.]